jgi:hypothetical protein
LPKQELGIVPVRPQLSVPEFIGTEREQQQTFGRALRYFTPAGASVPLAELVPEDPAPSLLLIHAAAALAAQDGQDRVVSLTSVVSRLFEIEQQRWRSRAEGHRLGALPENVLRRAVLMAALLGAADRPAADNLLSHLPELAGAGPAQQRQAVAGWLRELYPQQAPDWLTPRLPAVLLEEYAAASLRDDPHLVDAMMAAIAHNEDSGHRLITVLGRARAHTSVAAAAVGQPCLQAGGG